MAINSGGDTVQDLYWGADRVKRVYLGENLLHQVTLTKSEKNIHRSGQKITFSEDEIGDFFTKLRVRASLTLKEGGELESTGLYPRFEFKYAVASPEGVDSGSGMVGQITVQAGTTGTVEKEILLNEYPGVILGGSGYPSDLIEIVVTFYADHSFANYPEIIYAEMECTLLA